MSDKEENSWGVPRSTASTIPIHDNWDYDIEDIHQNDNFLLSPDAYTGCFEMGQSYSSGQIAGRDRMPLQNTMIRRTQPQFDLQHTASSSFQNPTQVLSRNNQNWMSQSNMNIVPGYSRCISSNAFSCRAPRNPEGQSLISFSSCANAMSGVPGFAMVDSPGGSESLDSDRMSPSTTYSTSFTTGITSDPMAVSFNSLAVHDNDTTDTKWWEEILRGSTETTAVATLPFSCDGLPSQTFTTMPQLTEPISHWSISAGTVSPQALTLDPPSISMITSGSSSGVSSKISCGHHSSSGTSSRSLRLVTATPAASQRILSEAQKCHSQSLNSRSRHKLPSKPASRSHIPILPSSNRGVAKSERKQSQSTRPIIPTNTATQHNDIERNSIGRKFAGISRTLIPKSETKSTNVESSSNSDTSRSSASTQAEKNSSSKQSSKQSTRSSTKPSPKQPTEQPVQQTLQHRDHMDKFLVKSKLAGISYKEIRRKGGFTEAESTLRGRFRTLTKKKDERVRRPEWDDNDIQLLKKAVRKLSHGSDPTKMKTPWKQVADYIFDHGGSYHFGNATCRKRWDQIQVRSA